MKNTIKLIFLFSLILSMFAACNEEPDYIDGMVSSITQEGNDKLTETSAMEWNSALIALQENRQKMIAVLNQINNGGYTSDEYDLQNPDRLKQDVEIVINDIDHHMDSIWNTFITDTFSIINSESQGIQTFGAKKYINTSLNINSINNWLKADYKADTSNWIAKDFEVLKKDVSDLYYLNTLNDNEVIAYVENLKTNLSILENNYPTIENEVNTSPFFSAAQKTLYTEIGTEIDAMKVALNGDITLQTRDELELLTNDLAALTYFVNNNYTSPALEPKVYGEISSICELRWFSEEATTEDYAQDWVLTCDIDAAETHRWNLDQPEQGFQQIFEYTGNFDGQYHIISGMLLTKYGGVDVNRAGMFHYFLGGTIQNFALINLYINSTTTENGQGGALIGYVKPGEDGTPATIERCFVHGTKELSSQDGGFIGRTRGSIIRDCFSAVDCYKTGANTSPTNTSSFIATTITGPHTIENIINIGVSQDYVFIAGGASTNILSASGMYYDASAVGVTKEEKNAYAATTTMKIGDEGVIINLPTDQWNDLANFENFSPEVWEVRTVSTIDDTPRPYLKGFNYEAISTFIIPEFNYE